MSWISIDIDLDEIYDQMSDRDKKDMYEWIMEDMDKELDYYRPGPPSSLMNDDWTRECAKLSSLYYRMSDDDMELIKNIIKKY